VTLSIRKRKKRPHLTRKKNTFPGLPFITNKGNRTIYISKTSCYRYKRAWEPRKQNDESSESKKPCLDSNGERIKRRKCAILLAYSGVNFFGMQRNPEMKTIEEELLKAMLKNEWINEEGFNQPQDLQFQRAARTDKGVSAVQQVVSMKLRELDQNEEQ
jgi:hypothetical protein